MKSYVLILLADILLAGNFAFQKLYSKKQGESISSGFLFNIFMGFFGCIILFFGNGFKIETSWFSLLCALMQTASVTLYTLISFKILNHGNLALYTLFLMTGGMTLPYIFGLIFLKEPFFAMHLIGLILIIFGVIFSNTGVKKLSKDQIILCVFVFILNGITSIVSKIHQVSITYNPINSESFTFWTSFFKMIICIPLYLAACRKDTKSSSTAKISLSSIIVVLFASAAGCISYLFQLIGAVNIPSTILYPLITGGSIILTALTGMIFFKEKITRNQLISIALCFIGTCFFI